MPPIVDIIMPVHNQLKFTEACLNSLYRYTDPKQFHLIIIDNASTDGSAEFLKKYSENNNNITLIVNTENLGWCKALNIGFKYLHPDTEYVLWANNDILFEHNWLNKMIKHFHAQVGAVGPTSNYVAGRQSIIYNHGHYEEETPVLIGFCLMFRKEVVKLVGDVDERFGIGGSEELDYILRMKKELGFKCVIARDVYIHHFGSKTLYNYTGGIQESYNKFCIEKDEILKEKWGEKEINKWLDYPENFLLIGIPHPGYIHHSFWKDTIFLKKPPMTSICDVPRTSAIHDARNEIVQFALENNYKYLLFLDSDMRVPENTIFTLLQYNVPIASGYFFARNKPHFPCAFTLNNNKCKSIYKPYSGLIEVDATGMACTLINTEILKKMKKPWFYWSEFSEDITFCLNVRKLGYKIFVDTNLIIKHIGPEKEIGPEDFNPNET